MKDCCGTSFICKPSYLDISDHTIFGQNVRLSLKIIFLFCVYFLVLTQLIMAKSESDGPISIAIKLYATNLFLTFVFIDLCLREKGIPGRWRLTANIPFTRAVLPNSPLLPLLPCIKKIGSLLCEPFTSCFRSPSPGLSILLMYL